MTIRGEYKAGDQVECILYGTRVKVRLLNNANWFPQAWEVISEDRHSLRFILRESEIV